MLDECSDENLQAELKKKSNENKEVLVKLQTNLEMTIEQSAKAELMEQQQTNKKEKPKKKKKTSAPVESKAVEKEKIDPELNKQICDELFGDIFGMQEEQMQIVEEMIRKAEETNVLADDSLNILKRQEEQLKAVEATLDKMGGNLSIASKQLKAFGAKLARTKIIFVIIICICCCILCVVLIVPGFFYIFKIFFKKKFIIQIIFKI